MAARTWVKGCAASGLAACCAFACSGESSNVDVPTDMRDANAMESSSASGTADSGAGDTGRDPGNGGEAGAAAGAGGNGAGGSAAAGGADGSAGSAASGGAGGAAGAPAVPSCEDGLSNGTETGIDCGGNCDACACPPGLYFCDGAVRRQCNVDGATSSALPCPTAQACDSATATCQAVICEPGSRQCNGVYSSTCNTSGTDVEPGGTDCRLTNAQCYVGTGACCELGRGPIDQLKLDLVKVYYDPGDAAVRLRNLSPDCPIDLNGVTFTAVTATDRLVHTFDNLEVAPGAGGGIQGTLRITTNFRAQPGDFALRSIGDITYQTPGYVALCDGACNLSDGSNVLDLVAIGGAYTLPSPLTFAPAPLSYLVDQLDKSYERYQWNGSHPNFLRNDWRVVPLCDPASCTNIGPCCTSSEECGQLVPPSTYCMPL